MTTVPVWTARWCGVLSVDPARAGLGHLRRGGGDGDRRRDPTLAPGTRRDPSDWGERTVTTYRDHIGELAFHAVFDLGPLEAVLASNTNKGLIVVAGFYRFKDGRPATNFLCREFFYRLAG